MQTIPREVVAKFKLKLQPVKGMHELWSSKGSTMKKKLSIWSAELEGAGGRLDLRKQLRSSVRLSFDQDSLGLKPIASRSVHL